VRSAESKKRIAGELRGLSGDDRPREVISVEEAAAAATAAGDTVLQCKMHGPQGTPYEHGTFLLEIKLPLAYPAVPPQLSFVTPIKHCNIEGGVPCPNLLYGQWGPSNNVKAVLTQLVQILKEPSKSDALVPALAQMDDATLRTVVGDATRLHATADQEFSSSGDTATSSSGASSEPAAAERPWPHDYLVIRGEFRNLDAEGGDVQLPRIKLTFGSQRRDGAGAAGNSADAGVRGAATLSYVAGSCVFSVCITCSAAEANCARRLASAAETNPCLGGNLAAASRMSYMYAASSAGTS